jgi:hypothetical protein
MTVARLIVGSSSLFFVSGSASAQTRPDQEYRDDQVETEDKLGVEGLFETEYYEFSNLDFRPLDESSDQAILDSDDRGAFAFTGASLTLSYAVDDQVDFVIGAGHRGIWGDDQIGSVNQFGGFLYIPSLYTDLRTSKDPDKAISFKIGRQFFQIGGMGGARDYVLADVLDMVRVDAPLGKVGTLTLVPINVFSVSSDYANVDFIGLLGQQNAETFEFRGATLTRRYGGMATLDELPGPLDATAYVFWSDVGARGTGSDLSYDGQLGNVSDNDFVWNYGLRLAAAFGPVRPFAHFDGSYGLDRKEKVAQDVDTNGFAYGGGLRVDTRDEGEPAGLTSELSFFDAFGGGYSANGLQYSHGYVGMKGQQVGGTLFNRFLGMHPTAYLGRNGVSDSPQNQDRIAGTMFLHADAGYTLANGFGLWAGYWFLMDRGVTQLNLANLDDLTPPFGYSRSEFAAQQRLGKTLGHEVNLEARGYLGEHVQLYLNGAAIVPGAFYGITVDRVAGTALGSPNPAMPWSIYGGTRVTF